MRSIQITQKKINFISNFISELKEEITKSFKIIYNISSKIESVDNYKKIGIFIDNKFIINPDIMEQIYINNIIMGIIIPEDSNNYIRFSCKLFFIRRLAGKRSGLEYLQVGR